MNDAVRIVDDLRDGLVGAEAQQALAQRLARDPELRKQVIEDWHLQRRLSCLLADEDTSQLWQRIADDLWTDRASNEAQRSLAAVQRRISARRQVKHRQRKMNGWPIKAAFLTAAAALIAIVLIVRDNGASPTVASTTIQVASMQGEVHIRRAGTRLFAQRGMELKAHDHIETQSGAVVVLDMYDGSRLNLSATSDLGWEGKAHFRLNHGTIAVTAQPRALNDAMTIATPRTTTTVVGTQFTLSYRAGTTALQVTEGIVKFAADGHAERLVKAGENADDAPIIQTPPVVPPTVAQIDDVRVIGFRFVDAASGDDLPGWEMITANVQVDMTKMPQHGWTVEALTHPKRLSEVPPNNLIDNKNSGSRPALQFRINGTNHGKPHINWPYNLNMDGNADVPNFKFQPWNPGPGTHRIEAFIIRSKEQPVPIGTPLSITVTITPAP